MDNTLFIRALEANNESKSIRFQDGIGQTLNAEEIDTTLDGLVEINLGNTHKGLSPLQILKELTLDRDERGGKLMITTWDKESGSREEISSICRQQDGSILVILD
ncbi:hypothetical protein L1D14_07360 [Vibrio tubiashii]|uniref:hypothetical protein n=1 Tax=Vibrio tubiashii TaxID=29498 RepID=UPI001EFDCA1B|nr:hypothetical protein [Vibrio tubiashii]MCG9576055.1 hypothetical protein [Vibrio tubiashii]